MRGPPYDHVINHKEHQFVKPCFPGWAAWFSFVATGGRFLDSPPGVGKAEIYRQVVLYEGSGLWPSQTNAVQSVLTRWARRGVGASITYAVESSRHALIRPGLWPAHLPPQGKALASPKRYPFISRKASPWGKLAPEASDEGAMWCIGG